MEHSFFIIIINGNGYNTRSTIERIVVVISDRNRPD